MSTKIVSTASALAISAGMLAGPLHANAPAAQLEQACERHWMRDSGTYLSGPAASNEAMLKQWRSHQAQCGSTYTYAGRLALIQVLANDIPGAKATLANAPKGKSPFAYSLDAARIQLAVAERLSQPGPLTARDMREFEASYAALIDTYPNWPTGFALLGGVQTYLGKHKEAIRNLEVAAKGDAYDLSSVYRNLTISLTGVAEYARALEAAEKAFSLNQNLTSDAAFAYAAATADSALGHLDDAETVLKVILAKRPEVRTDPEFLRAVDFYREQRRRLEKK